MNINLFQPRNIVSLVCLLFCRGEVFLFCFFSFLGRGWGGVGGGGGLMQRLELNLMVIKLYQYANSNHVGKARCFT